MAASFLSRLSHESGVSAIIHSDRNTKVLCLSRFVRMFAYGLTYPTFVQFLSSLGNPDDRIGLFMTLTLLGDTLISFVLTAVTDRVGRRRVLALGALLMIFAGLVFTFSSSFWVLVLASIVGVISPSGKEIGPFRAVEESVLAQLTAQDFRSDIFAWYTLVGTAGLSLGTLWCGWMVQILQGREDWAPWAYRSVFVVYAVAGVAKLLFILALTPEVELLLPETTDQRTNGERETERLLPDNEQQEGHEQEGSAAEAEERNGASQEPRWSTQQAKQSHPTSSRLLSSIKSLVPYITPESRAILFRLLLLFGLDSFASGMASPSWLTYFFTSVHSLDYGPLGTLFLVSNILAAVSNIVALPLSRRLGPLKTMVFTHLPSAVFLALIPWAPVSSLGTWIAMALLALRSSTSSMDQAPRQAFLSAAVLPAERTAVLGVVNMVKTLAQAGGIGSAGFLVNRKQWIPTFTGAGAMKAGYDLLMLWLFLGITSREAAA